MKLLHSFHTIELDGMLSELFLLGSLNVDAWLILGTDHFNFEGDG